MTRIPLDPAFGETAPDSRSLGSKKTQMLKGMEETI
jgi:hypothetical protein